MSDMVRYLGSLNGYPIPRATLETIALSAGLDTGQEVNPENLRSKECKRATAQVYLWLSTAPNVSQGGISYSFSDDDRARFLNKAKGLLDEIGEGDELGEFGYMGEDL